MTLRLFKRGLNFLITPVQSELEFYKLIFYLQTHIQGTADCFLEEGKKIIRVVKLGVRPSRVYNSAKEKWQSFEEFKDDPFSFAWRDRMCYAFWIQEKLLLNGFQ